MSNYYRNRTGIIGALTKGPWLYLLVSATVLVLVSIGALVFRPEEDEPTVSVPSDSEISQPSSDEGSVTDPITDEPSSESSVTSDTDVSVSEPEDEVEWVSMIVPVAGSVGTDFSSTVPVFSQTMNDWRVHQGIDYLTESEAQVVAAADGVVENVYRSELMGLSVEIRHADGSISIYQSLSGDPAVIEGQEVRCGDLLGYTGVSADCECLVGIHLHFAVVKDGVYQDPNDRFVS